MPELAAEAEFQLLAATDQLNWLTALASAIQLDHTHGRGRAAKYLAELAEFLSDTGFSGVETAIDQFKVLHESASQKLDQTSHDSSVGGGQ
jgi:hypothetical protein